MGVYHSLPKLRFCFKCICDVSGYSHMMLRISEFRTGLTKVATYGHIPVPLVYTQVGKTKKKHLGGGKNKEKHPVGGKNTKRSKKTNTFLLPPQ